MSQLETYVMPSDHKIMSFEGNSLAVNLNPGAEVRHGHFEGTKGLLIANGDDFVTILWTVAPPGPIYVDECAMIREVQDEIDAEILSVLRAQAKAEGR